MRHFKNVKMVTMLAALAAIAAPDAPAALEVTDGDFEAGGGFNANVTDWFDGTIGSAQWDDTFQDTNPYSPQAGTTVVWSGNANAKNFLYQPIGTREASDATIDVSIVVGGGATGPFTVGIYQSATFSGADGTDVAGASGVTLIDSATWDIDYAAEVVGPEMTTLSLATANLSYPIFLRFHFGEDGMADGWLRGDNITMTVQSAPDLALIIAQNGANLDFTWDSQAGMLYNLKSSNDLTLDFASWTLVEGDIPATAPLNAKSIPRPADPFLFYIVEEYPPPPLTILSENFDGIDPGWTSGADAVGSPATAWELGNPAGGAATGPVAANSPDNCYGTNIGSDYGLGTDIWLRTPSMDLTAHTAGTLEFKQFRDIEAGFLDFGSIRMLAADDLAELAVLEDEVEGTSANWEDYSKALPAAAFNEAIIIEFRFASDGEVNQAGWYIDDVMVTVPAP